MSNPTKQPTLRVSVIIPTYNRARYLAEALASVAAQSLAPWEILVVDDGSTDNTAELVQAFGSGVRYIRHVQNRGVSAARNAGLEAARGDIIAWLDADDLWEPDFLETVIPLLESDEGLDGIYTGFAHIDDAGEPLPQSSSKVVPPANLYGALAEDCFLVTPSIVVRKRCFERVGRFDPQFGICEDYDMWLRLAKEFVILGVPDHLTRIRIHQDNTMRDADAFCRFRLALTQKHFGIPEGDPRGWPLEKQRAHGFAYRAAALNYVQQGQLDLGWRFLSTAVDVYPPLFGYVKTFYELAYGAQPRGFRGGAYISDVEANGAELIRRLEALLAHASPRVQAMRSTAFGHAYLALGMLSDQAGAWGIARRYLLHAIRVHPSLLRDPSIARRFIKLCLGRRVVNGMRRLQPRFSSRAIQQE